MSTYFHHLGWLLVAGGLALTACASEAAPPEDTISADDEAALAAAASDPRCNAANLHWKTANKTNFTSYPAPGSDECVHYNGCEYEGEFAACSKKESKTWVKAHNIVSVFPNFNQLKLHDLCLKKVSSTIVVTVLDECADSDCDGCCTENRGSANELIDIESYTDRRWGVDDGPIKWADLGPTKTNGCK